MLTRIISIGRGSRLDKGFTGQDEGSAGAGAATARLATTRKRPSEELSATIQGEQLMIRATAMIFVPQGATLGIPVEFKKHGGKVIRYGEPQHCPALCG